MLEGAAITYDNENEVLRIGHRNYAHKDKAYIQATAIIHRIVTQSTIQKESSDVSFRQQNDPGQGQAEPPTSPLTR